MNRLHLRASAVYVLIASIPIVVGFVFLQAVEPFPHGWLNPSNAHYWANLLRAFTLLLGGTIIGMIVYTMVRSVNAEGTVSGGHPRRLLYRHVSFVAAAHGLLILTLMFYIRERINLPLSFATPFALTGLIVTVYALALMIGYQNSRLARFHSAKQVLGTVSPEEYRGRQQLCLYVVGSTEPISLEEWLDQFSTGDLVRLTVEKIEEQQ